MGPRALMIMVAFHILILLQFTEERSDDTSLVYKAAVVEYSAPLGITMDNKGAHYQRNVDTFAHITKRAAELDCDIIVFPEYGLLSMDLPKLEDDSPSLAVRIPAPEQKINPCVDGEDGRYKDLRELSCAARASSIYLVVNVVEAEPCRPLSGDCGECSEISAGECVVSRRHCPKSGVLYHNSNVVFDREGTVIARYRMYHLYGEMPLVPPGNPEHIVIETDFGVRFGMFICFDMSFQEPASKLITELGVQDILYSTCWFSEMPFQTAVQYQAAWAHAMDVNLLSSGYNYPGYGTGGSGIYAGRMGTLVAVMPQVRSSYLLVATVVKKHAPCYDQFFKLLPSGLVIPLPGDTSEETVPPYEYDRNYPVALPAPSARGSAVPCSIKDVQWEDRDRAIEDAFLPETMMLDIPEKCVEEREGPGQGGQDSQAARGKEGEIEFSLFLDRSQDDTQPCYSEEEPSSKKKCGCKKLPSDIFPEESREPTPEQDESEQPVKCCGEHALNVKLDDIAPEEKEEPPQQLDNSEPPVKVTKCDRNKVNVKHEDNEESEDLYCTREPPQQQDLSETPEKGRAGKPCDVKTLTVQLERNAPVKCEEFDCSTEPPQQQDHSDPHIEVSEGKPCDVKTLTRECEELDYSTEPPHQQDHSDQHMELSKEMQCDRKKSSLDGQVELISEEIEELVDNGHQDDDKSEPNENPFGGDETEMEEDLESTRPCEKCENVEQEEGGDDAPEDTIDEEEGEKVEQCDFSGEEVTTNMPHPCIEESLIKNYAQKWLPSYVLPQNKPGSGLHIKREKLEDYITFKLTSDRMKENSSVKLCHGIFCCDFDVVLCSGGECSDDTRSKSSGPRYNYRLVAFDGVRDMDQFGEGRYQVCAVISCTDESLESCGQFIKDPNVNINNTRFSKLLISGFFTRLNTIIGANTVAHNLLPLPVSNFEFSSENISEIEMHVTMESIVPELTFLTFGIYGRNYDVDDFRINKVVCEV